MEKRKQTDVTKANESQKNISPRAPWAAEDKAQLAVAIGTVFDLQKQYGKQTSQIENIVSGFCWVLQAYPVGKVMSGLAEYVRANSDMPTPSDIVKIIDPKPAPWRPDKAYYVSLKKIHAEQGPYGLDGEEMEYIKLYEDYARKELRESDRS